MRRVLLLMLVVLCLGSGFLYWTQPGRETDLPKLSWITQDDHNKREIVATFRQWLRDEGYPDVDLRIDNTNQDATKKLVQGLSGVGADLLDIYTFQQDVFPASGMLRDVTEDARRLGFGPEKTYPALRPELMHEGRQYGFPRNLGATLFIVNRGTFERLGVPVPPWRWSPDEFEELGRRFVAAANPPGTRQRAFFANSFDRVVLRRSLGLSTFNETGTRCTLDDPRHAAVLERVRQWIHVDRLIPSKEEDAAMSADISGYGAIFSHFSSGRFGMIYTGHWALMMLRPRGDFAYHVVEHPQAGFPNHELGSGIISVYAGTRHPEHALRFLQFLTSDPFNRLIIRQADALPPLPRFAQTEEFLHPAGRENEWEMHGAFARASLETGIALSKSPFVLHSMVYRIELEVGDLVMAGRITPQEGARQIALRINTEIDRAIRRNDRLRRLHEERSALQRRIEERRAAGLRVPASWVTDPFHEAFYRAQGWLEEEGRP